MHNAAFAAAGLPHLYLRYHVPPEHLPAALDEARRLDMGGLNLTVPLKEAVRPLLDAVTPEAERIGAVNTVLPENGALVGYNTDVAGFLEPLAPLLAREHLFRMARVIGAGGAETRSGGGAI